MFPFKKILCPTDFSEPSLCGLRLAADMAAGNDTEIVVLNVHRPIPHLPTPRDEAPDVTFDVSSYEEQVRAETQKQLAAFAGGALPDDANIRLEVRMGRPAKEILKCADEEMVDAVVIATHGRTGLAHMVFGSVAEMVVRYAPCPVVTIRSCE
jgi:nucleotide-binding universal stress UspA family protein